MLKPNSTFKLSKQTKRFMTTIVDDNQRAVFKQVMIQAQLAAEEAKKQNSKSKDKE
jgi:hypothetical protein